MNGLVGSLRGRMDRTGDLLDVGGEKEYLGKVCFRWHICSLGFQSYYPFLPHRVNILF